MRMCTLKGFPKTDLKSKRALKSYSRKIHNSAIWFFLHFIVQKQNIASERHRRAFINHVYVASFLYLVIISLLFVCVFVCECLSVCLYVCTHVGKLFLNRIEIWYISSCVFTAGRSLQKQIWDWNGRWKFIQYKTIAQSFIIFSIVWCKSIKLASGKSWRAYKQRLCILLSIFSCYFHWVCLCFCLSECLSVCMFVPA